MSSVTRSPDVFERVEDGDVKGAQEERGRVGLARTFQFATSRNEADRQGPSAAGRQRSAG
jgi:hypothetical protein